MRLSLHLLRKATDIFLSMSGPVMTFENLTSFRPPFLKEIPFPEWGGGFEQGNSLGRGGVEREQKTKTKGKRMRKRRWGIGFPCPYHYDHMCYRLIAGEYFPTGLADSHFSKNILPG